MQSYIDTSVQLPRCAGCCEPIGVFEPMVWRLTDETDIAGHVLRRPATRPGNAISATLHGACVGQLTQLASAA
jgi:hypothetical protein